MGAADAKSSRHGNGLPSQRPVRGDTHSTHRVRCAASRFHVHRSARIMTITELPPVDLATPTGPMRTQIFKPAAPGKYPGGRPALNDVLARTKGFLTKAHTAQKHPNAALGHPNVAPRHSNVAPRHPNVLPRHPNVSPRHLNVLPRHSNVSPRHPDVLPTHPNVSQRHPNVSSGHPNGASGHPNLFPRHSGTTLAEVRKGSGTFVFAARMADVRGGDARPPVGSFACRSGRAVDRHRVSAGG